MAIDVFTKYSRQTKTIAATMKIPNANPLRAFSRVREYASLIAIPFK
jgi:hypothetical protein